MNQTPQQIAATSPALTKISTQPPPFLYPPVWANKVPLKVKMAIDVKSDLPFSTRDKKENTIATKNNEYYVWVNSYGAVSAIFEDGTKLGLKPYEFEVVEWHNTNILKSNNINAAINFVDFCRTCKNIKQVHKAADFYKQKFEAEKVVEYFENWTLKYDDSTYKNGVILTNKHSTENWQTTITINDDAAYMFSSEDSCWHYFPKTFSEFISDVLRYQDFDLIFSSKAIALIY